MALSIPLLMPKSAGFSCALGSKVMSMRLKPNRASLTSRLPNDVRLVQRQDLAVRVTRVAEAGNGVALQGRLAALVALERVVAVQRVGGGR